MSFAVETIPAFEPQTPNDKLLVKGQVPRDGLLRPLIVPRTGGKPVALTRTTTFIDALDDKSALGDWKVRMVLEGLHDDVELMAEWSALVSDKEFFEPDVYRKRLNAFAAKVLEASGAHRRADKGTWMHHLTEILDGNGTLPEGLPDEEHYDLAEYQIATADLEWLHRESFVVIEELGCAGTPDGICHYAGPGPDGTFIEGNFIEDLKTGSLDYSKLKFASQMAAYSHGEFYDYDLFHQEGMTVGQFKNTPWDGANGVAYTPLPDVSQEWGILVHLPLGSAEATLYWVDLSLGWEAANLAKTVRETRKLKSKALIPFVS